MFVKFACPSVQRLCLQGFRDIQNSCFIETIKKKYYVGNLFKKDLFWKNELKKKLQNNLPFILSDDSWALVDLQHQEYPGCAHVRIYLPGISVISTSDLQADRQSPVLHMDPQAAPAFQLKLEIG